MKNLESINSVEELEVCKKLTAPIEPTLAAIRSRTQMPNQFPTTLHTHKLPHNKKIIPQRRLYTTKKTCKKSKTGLNLSNTDRNSIAVQLLN